MIIYCYAILTLLFQVLLKERSDAETAYRAFVALGNTVSAVPPKVLYIAMTVSQLFALKQQGTQLSPAEAAGVRSAASTLRSQFPEDRVKSVVKDIESLL